MSLPPELAKQIKLLEIATRKRVNGGFLGEYHSAFKGQGMTFSEFREYVPGDDVRTIAWPLVARTGKTFIKKFDEEREMTVILAVDVSGSQDFGTKQYFKGETAAHIAAMLAFAAQGSRDAVGLYLFSDRAELFVPPKKGRGQVMRILRDLYYHQPASKRTGIGTSLEWLFGTLRKKTHVFVISDFLDENFEPALRRLAKKHDCAAIVIDDPFEHEIPPLGLIDFEDPETGEICCVDTSSAVFRRAFASWNAQGQTRRRDELRRAQVDTITIGSGGDLVAPLIGFFRRRSGR